MSEQQKPSDAKPGSATKEPTAEHVRIFTERLLAMGGVPGRFWPQ